jgi:alcohol dehydrogenase (cytochrome c)
MNWFFQYTPGDMFDYDEVGTHILIDGEILGQPRQLITHSARNGFLYTMDRHNGQIIGAKPYMDNVNWTKGIDQKTGKPIDYDRAKDIQTYAGLFNLTPPKKVCPAISGGNNFWPSSYSPRTKLLYVPALTGCMNIEVQRDAPSRSTFGFGNVWAGGRASTDERFESNLTAIDPISQDVKKNVHLPYPNASGTLATAGGLIFVGLMDGTVAAFGDTTLDELWRVNLGSGFAAPPMSFEVNGRQYVAIASGPSAPTKARVNNTPELKDQRHATVLYVFGL